MKRLLLFLLLFCYNCDSGVSCGGPPAEPPQIQNVVLAPDEVIFSNWSGTDDPLHLGVDEAVLSYDTLDYVRTKVNFRGISFGFTNPGGSIEVSTIVLEIAAKVNWGAAQPLIRVTPQVNGYYLPYKHLGDWSDGVTMIDTVMWTGLNYSATDMASLLMFYEVDGMDKSMVTMYATDVIAFYFETR